MTSLNSYYLCGLFAPYAQDKSENQEKCEVSPNNGWSVGCVGERGEEEAG